MSRFVCPMVQARPVAWAWVRGGLFASALLVIVPFARATEALETPSPEQAQQIERGGTGPWRFDSFDQLRSYPASWPESGDQSGEPQAPDETAFPDDDERGNPSDGERDGPGANDPASENKNGVSPQVLSLPSGEGSVDGLGESFEPLISTGGVSFSLPIAVPPARGRVGPSLAFSYHSGGGQGVLGMGWSVGVPSVQRQTDKGLPRYAGDDRFAFNGEELVPVSKGPGGHLPPGARAYRLKLEGRFWRFFYFPNDTDGQTGTWLAQDKEGSTYRFGTTPASRIENDEGVFRWNCSEVVDVHGNRAVYEYLGDDGGQSYLRAVSYNEASDNSYRDRIELHYEGRPDALTAYVSGHAVRTLWRLASVTVDTEYEPGQRRRVRSYQLSYQPDSHHTLLRSIQLFGNDGIEAYPPVRFEYTEVTGRNITGEVDPSMSISGHGYFDATVRQMDPSPGRNINDSINDLLDVDGDSLPDLFITDLVRNQRHTWMRNLDGARFEVLLPGDGVISTFDTGERYLDGGDRLNLSNRNVQLLDLDGNGRVDLLHMPKSVQYNYYRLEQEPERVGWLKCDTDKCGDGAGSIPVQPQIDFRGNVSDMRLLDVNNDHLIDVVMTTNSATKVWLNLGGTTDAQGQSGWGRFGNGELLPDGAFDPSPIETCPLYKGGYVRFGSKRVQLGDMNGDGLQDIVLLQRGDIVYWPGRGYGSFGKGSRACPKSLPGSKRHVSMGRSPYFSDLNLVEMRLVDVNGDNLSDLIEVMADTVRIWLNEGGHAFSDPLLIERTPSFVSFSRRIRGADMNGSGSVDLVWGDAGRYRTIDFTGGIKPRLLRRIDNGLGKVTTLEWESSTAHSHRLAHGNCYQASHLMCLDGWSPQNPTYERQGGWSEHNPHPVQVFARVSVTDSFPEGAGLIPGFVRGAYVTEYRYFDPYYDSSEHEFRGFGYVEAKSVGDANSPTSITKTWFYRGKPPEDEALKGVVWRQETVDPGLDSPAPSILSTTVDQWTVQQLEQGLDGRLVRQAYASQAWRFLYDTASFSPGSHAVGLTTVRVVQLDGTVDAAAETMALDAVPEAAILTETVLDRHGNELEKREHGRVIPGAPGLDQGDERVTVTEWAFHPGTWVHRPVHTYVTGQDPGVRYNESFFCYDHNAPCGAGAFELGDLTREEALVDRDPVDGARRIVRLEHDYDTYGHVIRTVAGGHQERRFVYGGPGDRFFVHVTAEQVVVDAATTLVARAEWDPGFGKIRRHEDFNYIAGDARAVTTITYDALGRVWQIHQPHVLPDGSQAGACAALPTVQLAYTLGSPVSSVARFEREMECEPSSLLVSVTYTDGLGRVRQTLAEDTGNQWIITDHVTFDAKGGEQRAYQPFFHAVAQTVVGHGPQPYPAFQALPGEPSPHTTTGYDAFGRPILTVLEDGFSYSKTRYHALSQDEWDANDTDDSAAPQSAIYHGTYTTLTNDGLERLTRVAERNRTAAGGPLVTTRWSYVYDPMDSLVSITDPAGNQKVQRFDSLGRKIGMHDPNAGTWAFRYDDADNLIERVDGKASKAVYTYDGSGRPLSEDYYDKDGAPFPGMQAGVRYFYDHPACPAGDSGCEALIGGTQADLLGRLSYVQDLTGSSYFSYDARGREVFRTREIEGTYFTTRTSHDALDRQTSITYPELSGALPKVVHYLYDQRGLLHSVPGYVSQIDYNASGQRLSVAYADDGQTLRTSTYDQRLRPSSLGIVQQATGKVLLDETYELDRVGNFLAILQRPDAPYAPLIKPSTRRMTYDGLDQLTRVLGPFGTARYAYDEVSNLTHRAMDHGGDDVGPFFDKTPGDYAYDSGRPYAVSFVARGTVSNPPDPHNGNFAYFDYDGSGNLIEAVIVYPGNDIMQLNLKWDALNRLVYAERYKWGVTTRVRFGYDHVGNRVFKRVEKPDGTPKGPVCGQAGSSIEPNFFDETTLYVDATTEVRGCRLTKFILANGRRVAREVTEDIIEATYSLDPMGQYTFFYHPDHLGSTSTVTTRDGTVVNHTTYHPYGSLEYDYTEPGFAYFSADYKYTDKELDEEIGLVYFGARYYWPELARWTSPDPLYLGAPEDALGNPRELVLYGYTLNSPYNFVDPAGTETVGELLDRQALQSVKRGSYAAGYGWTFLKTVWDWFGAEEVSKVTDAAVSGRSDLEATDVGVAALDIVTSFFPGSKGFKAPVKIATKELAGEALETGVKKLGKKTNVLSKTKSPTAGVYEFKAKSGKKYVGQSKDVPKRIKQHVRGGKTTKKAAEKAKVKSVSGDKTAREVAEQKRINQLGGIDKLENKVNPIGQKRKHLLDQ